MENELKFNSQICTTREQSQRLLDLGLKPETADINWTIVDDDREGNEYPVKYMSIGQGKYQLFHPNWYIPAWSLHRLMEIYSTSDHECFIITINRTFDDIIDDIEWSINRGYLNKKYLKS